MRQLGGIDATFLYMETPETPMHVAGLTLYGPPADLPGSFYDHFKDFFLTRMHLAPIFGKKLARTVLELDHPAWVDAGEIDISYHLRRATLSAPGNWKQLEDLVGELHSALLDRSRPLWQFTVIDGLDDGNVAIYSKMHHAAVDGGAGMAIAAALYDISPQPRKVKPPEPKPAGRKPTIEERAILGINDVVQNVMRQQLKALEAVPQVLGALTDLLIAKNGNSEGLPGIPGILAPKTPFDVTITAQRSFAARVLSLGDAKTIAKATGTKINDVVMAVSAGALRAYLEDHEALPKKALVAFVPISLRQPGDMDASNQVFGMFYPIATDLADPLERLRTIRKNSGDSKTLAGTVKDVSPKDYTLLGAPILFPGLAQIYGRTGLADIMPSTANLTISNVPGPPIPVFCAGAKVLAMFPVSIPIHGMALNITVQSYQDRLDFGITADRRAVPDTDHLGDLLITAMAELKAAAEKLPSPSPKATRQ